MIAGALISSYVDMYRAKAALASGERVEAVAQAFNYKAGSSGCGMPRRMLPA